MEVLSVGFGYSFHLRQLTCLKNSVGGPVWVLEKTNTQSEAKQIGLKVSLTVQDFQELGGLVGYWEERLIEAQSLELKEDLSSLSAPKTKPTTFKQMRLNATGHRKLPPFQSRRSCWTAYPRL